MSIKYWDDGENIFKSEISNTNLDIWEDGEPINILSTGTIRTYEGSISLTLNLSSYENESSYVIYSYTGDDILFDLTLSGEYRYNLLFNAFGTTSLTIIPSAITSSHENDFLSDPKCVLYFPLDNSFTDLILNVNLWSWMTPSFSTNCKIGTHSVDFQTNWNGLSITTEYVDYIPLSISDPIKSGTFCFWLKSDSNDSNRNLLTKWSITKTFRVFRDYKRIKIDISEDGENLSNTYDTEIDIEDNEWYFLAICLDFSGNNNINVYSYRLSNDTFYSYDTTSENNIFIDNETIWIGEDFDGLIDDYVIFNRILTQNKIEDIAYRRYKFNRNINNFDNDPNCFAVWNFDGNYNDSKNTNHLEGTQNFTDLRITGTQSNIIDNNIEIGYIEDINLSDNFPLKSSDTNRIISVCAWLRYTTGSMGTIFSKGYMADSTLSFQIYNFSNQIKILCGFDGSYQIIETELYLDVNNWFHLTVCLDGNSSVKSLTVYLYKAYDGSVQTFSTNINHEIYLSTAFVSINGKQNGESDRADAFGIMDEVVVFNKILSLADTMNIIDGTYSVEQSNSFEYYGLIGTILSLSSEEKYWDGPIGDVYSYESSNPLDTINFYLSAIVSPYRYSGNMVILIDSYETEYNLKTPITYGNNIEIPIFINMSCDQRYKETFYYNNANINFNINLTSNIDKYLTRIFIGYINIPLRINPSGYYNFNFTPSESFNLTKLEPKFMVIDFNDEMSMSIITRNTKIESMKIYGQFRTPNDSCKMYWDVEDGWSHENQKYTTDGNFTDVKLEYQYNYEEYNLEYNLKLLNSTTYTSMTVIDSEDNEYEVNLWNYVINRPIDDWENTYGLFPNSRTPGAETGYAGTIEIDFNNLYTGVTPNDPNWEKIDVTNLKRIIWNYYPDNYVPGTDKIPLVDSKPFIITYSSWIVLNGDLPEIPIGDAKSTGLMLDYDLVCKLTPQRVIEHYYNLGFRNTLNILLGSFRWYDKIPLRSGDGLVEAEEGYYTNYLYDLNSENYINTPCFEWLRDILSRADLRSFTEPIISVPMKLVDVSDEWCQKSYNNYYCEDSYPKKKILSPCNTEVIDFYKNLFLNLIDLQIFIDLPERVQLFDPKWDKDINNAPLIYDRSVLDLCFEELSLYPYDIDPVTNIFNEENNNIEFLEWLNEKLNNFIIEIEEYITNIYPNSEFSVGLDFISIYDEETYGLLINTNILNIYIENANKIQFYMCNSDFYKKYGISQKAFNEIYNSRNLNKIDYISGYPILVEYTNNIFQNIKKSEIDGKLFGLNTLIYVGDAFNLYNLKINKKIKEQPIENSKNIKSIFKFCRRDPVIK
jgi:hypothetical protein